MMPKAAGSSSRIMAEAPAGLKRDDFRGIRFWGLCVKIGSTMEILVANWRGEVFENTWFLDVDSMIFKVVAAIVPSDLSLLTVIRSSLEHGILSNQGVFFRGKEGFSRFASISAAGCDSDRRGCGDTFYLLQFLLSSFLRPRWAFQALPLSLISSQEITFHIFTCLAQKGKANLFLWRNSVSHSKLTVPIIQIFIFFFWSKTAL